MRSHFQGRTFDLIIIGGGIIGSGIARDAALRGLKTVLFEKGDYCAGTTAHSTRLIHGGLRYLETLDFKLVRMDLLERETLLRIAAHLVKPLPFLVPFYNRSTLYRGKVLLGMILYDLLGFDKSLPSHRRVSRSEILASEPLLDPKGLQGGFLYYDAQVPLPERLVIENLVDAREHGAETYNYCEVTGVVRTGKCIQGVRVRNRAGEREQLVGGRVIVNASGPWLDQVSAMAGIHSGTRIRLTKGVHLISAPLSRQALVLFSNIDSRLFFVVPWLGQSLVGTTDTDYAGDPGAASPGMDDVGYLLGSIRAFIPSLGPKEIRYSYAGIRALVPGEGTPSAISRMHRIIDEDANGSPGLISVLGGKITGYRAIAEEAVDLACLKLGIHANCRTAGIPLPGCRTKPGPAPDFLSEGAAKHLHELYGSRTAGIYELAQSSSRLRKPLAPNRPDIAAQVIYSIRNEQCMHATDFLLRRTSLGLAPDRGCSALSAVADCMAEELNWSDTERENEIERHLQQVQH